MLKKREISVSLNSFSSCCIKISKKRKKNSPSVKKKSVNLYDLDPDQDLEPDPDQFFPSANKGSGSASKLNDSNDD